MDKIKASAAYFYFLLFAILLVLLFVDNQYKNRQKAKIKNTMIKELDNLAVLARQFYHKPKKFGGGGGSFIDLYLLEHGIHWEIPDSLKTTKTAKYWIEKAERHKIVILGTSHDMNLQISITVIGKGGSIIEIKD